MTDTVFQKLLAFNHWANNLYLEKISSDELISESCINLMSHIIGAEIIWLQRINNQPITPSAFSPKKVLDLINLNQELTEKWTQKIAEIQMLDLPLVINYKNLEGLDFSSSFEDILIHVCNHGTYHRAQIAKELRKGGIKPPSTDYIVFSRG